MSTLQKQIRTYVGAQILATTGLTVLSSPRVEIPVENLPAIAVFSHSDKAVDAAADSSRKHQRIYTLAVDLTAMGRGEEDITEPTAILIRKAILADGSLGGLVNYTTWADQQWAGTETDKPMAGTVLLFSFHYFWSPEW
jgi:hypothetical protein